jgi:hypothetical protein
LDLNDWQVGTHGQFQLNCKAEDTALFADALLAPNGCRQGAGFFKTKNFKN